MKGRKELMLEMMSKHLWKENNKTEATQTKKWKKERTESSGSAIEDDGRKRRGIEKGRKEIGEKRSRIR